MLLLQHTAKLGDEAHQLLWIFFLTGPLGKGSPIIGLVRISWVSDVVHEFVPASVFPKPASAQSAGFTLFRYQGAERESAIATSADRHSVDMSTTRGFHASEIIQWDADAKL